MSRAVSSTSSSDGRRRDAVLPARRGLLAGAAALLALSGCGFRPLYGPIASADGGPDEDIRKELAAVRIGVIPERFGQLLRRDLQRRFEGSAPGTQGRYLLTVNVGMSADILGYRRDGAISRVRFTASGDWNLATQSVPPQIIGRNPLPYRSIDAFNVPDLQFFADDTSREAMERRFVEVISDEVFRHVAMTLRRYKETGQVQAGAGAPGPASGPGRGAG